MSATHLNALLAVIRLITRARMADKAKSTELLKMANALIEEIINS